MTDKPAKHGGPLYWLKRRSRRFWMRLALLPVLYVASFGPEIWITAREQPQEQIGRVVLEIAYWPLLLAIVDGPPQLAEPVYWSGELGVSKRRYAIFFLDASPQKNVLFGYFDPERAQRAQ